MDPDLSGCTNSCLWPVFSIHQFIYTEKGSLLHRWFLSVCQRVKKLRHRAARHFAQSDSCERQGLRQALHYLCSPGGDPEGWAGMGGRNAGLCMESSLGAVQKLPLSEGGSPGRRSHS